MLEQEPEAMAAVCDALDGDALEAIRAASRLAWVDAAPFDRLKQVHLDTVGETRYVQFWRVYMTSVGENPLFKALFEGGRRIFGASPAALVKWMPRGWAVSTRACGSFDVDASDRSATITIGDVPSCGRLRSTGLSSKGTILGLWDLTGTEGTVDMDDARMSDGAFTLRAHWS